MKYLFALIGDESRFAERSPEEMSESMKQWDAFTREAIDAGVHVGGEGLQPSATATTVKIQEGGEPIVTDGPFAETKEQLLGFYVLDCENLDEALEIARDLSRANPGGAYEIRPVRLLVPGVLGADALAQVNA